MTQFANFGALALATTGQHERWPDYAVSVHNWHLLNMRYFPFYMNVKKFSSFTFTLGSAFYGAAPTNYVFFFVSYLFNAVTAFNFPAPSVSNDNVTQFHEKASDKL